MSPHRSILRWAALVSLSALVVCTSDARHPTSAISPGDPLAGKGGPKAGGTIVVQTATTGADLDPDGYTVTVDSAGSKPVGTNGSVKFPNVNAGARIVTLSGIASNCTAPSNPQTVLLDPGATVTITFEVTCQAIPTTGSITAAAATSGADLDPDGYTVRVDDDATTARPLGVNDSTTYDGQSPGSHTVTLFGLAANCVVSGANPQTVNVTAGDTSTATFDVTCSALPTTGTLTVTTATTGADLDPDGYTVTIDGDTEGARPVGVNGSVTFENLSAGPHTVALSGLAGNCTTADNPRTVTVAAGETAQATFDVSCQAIPTTGNLAVSTTTTGSDLDPDGYTVTVDDDPTTAKPVAPDGGATFDSLSAGPHTVQLSGLAANCTTTDNPRTVTVAVGETTNTAFTVVCQAVPTTGTLTVTTTTTGSDIDVDGFTVTVDGNAETAKPVGVNGSVTFDDLSAGSHTVALSGLAANCTTTDNPRTVDVKAGESTSTSFAVACQPVPTTGDLAVATTTVGADLDPDGYIATIDGGASSKPVATNGSVTFDGLSAGTHTVELSGLAANCATTDNPRTVDVTAGTTATTTTFEVTCSALPTTGHIRVNTATTGSDLDPDGYTVTIDDDPTTAKPVAANGSVTFDDLGAGSHTVALSGLAANCTTTDNPRTVTVTAGETVESTFNVTCQAIPTTGDLTVTTTTTGADLDPDGYTVTVDGDPETARGVGISGSTTYEALSAGSHTIALSGLAANCTTTDNPRTVTVTAGSLAQTSFTVTCEAIVTTGNLIVTARTTGADLDPDGYTVSVDGGSGRPLGIDGSVDFNDLSAGAHTVRLSGLAANCSTTDNPRTVNITAGATTTTDFAVDCSASPPYTFVGAGNIAGCTWDGDEQTAKLIDGIVASDPGTSVFIVGDNAYDAATVAELADCFHPTWGRHKARIYAALGNHEYKIDPNPSWDYFGDRAGPRGKGYYSFDLGQYWHIVVLNDNWAYGGPGGQAGSAQDKWLQADLAANTKPCTIAIWHQPYVATGWVTLTGRKNFWSRLYDAGAEVVINAHAHHYERFAPQTPDLVRDDDRGLREFVVGTGGIAPNGIASPRAANSEVASKINGVLKLTLGPGWYRWEFVPVAGKTFTDSGFGTCR